MSALPHFRVLTLLPAAALSGVSVAAPLAAAATPPTAPTPTVTVASSAPRALTVAKSLTVKGRAPKTGYTRAKFGRAWSDSVSVAYGHDGCDTRNNILTRDLRSRTYKAGTQ